MESQTPKRVLFAYYPFKVHYNHGIALLSSILRNKGIEVFVIELGQLTHIKKIIKELKPDYVGFSMVCAQEYNQCLPFMKEAKKIGACVLVGGVYPRRGAFIDPSACDYICRGEGEILSNFILNGDKTIFETPYIHDDLDFLPLPDMNHLTGFEFDREIPFLKGIRIIPYHSSRGCPYSCSFCEVQFQPKKIRIKSTIREDLEILSNKFRPNLFHIMDELIPYYSEKWRSQMDGNKYPFMAYIRADIPQDHLEFLISNGLKVAVFGIENGDEDYRNKVLRKELMDYDIYRTVAILRANKIFYVPFYMIHGPFETDEIRGKTIGMARGIGGFPVLWEYEPLDKRVFSVDVKSIEKYAQKLGSTSETVVNNLNDVNLSVISNENGFLAYRFTPYGMMIQEIYGKGPYLEKQLENICYQYGIKRYYGTMKKGFQGLNRKYHTVEIGHVIERSL